jgi:hypothetical protein
VKAGRILDLYERVWNRKPLRDDEFVISADEKTSIQARRPCHATLPPTTQNDPPYNDARRVFWIVDNGSSHRGVAAAQRLYQKYPRLVLVHGPVHASWLNQIEIYFSVIQRKVLTPNDFQDLRAVAERLLNFQYHWETVAQPFPLEFHPSRFNSTP